MRSPRIALASALLLACGDGAEPQTPGDGSSSEGGAEDSTGSNVPIPGDGSSDDADADSGSDALVPDAGPAAYALIGETVVLDGSASTGAVAYQWNFGDGRPPTEPSPEPTASVSYDAIGRYSPVLTVFDADGNKLSASTTMTVTDEPTHQPNQSSSITRINGDGFERVAVVSPDSDELTVIERTDDAFGVLERFGVCDGPRTVSAWNDRWLVACPADDAITVVDPAANVLDRVELPRGSRPFGVVAIDDRMFVTLQSLGTVAELDGTTDAFELVAQHQALPDARGIAVLPDGRLAVTRWRSPDEGGQIAIVEPGGVTERVDLPFDPKPASDTEAGGVPTYLNQVLVSPVGDRMAVPALQANIGQGEFLDGNALTFETTLRAIVSYVDLGPLQESFEERKQFDDRGFMSAGVFSSRGDYLFLADRGSRAVERIDVFNGGQAGTLIDVGYAIEGLALSADDRYLYVDAYLSRSVVVYDVSDFSVLPTPVATLSTLTDEPLSADALLGKRLFNDAYDQRLAKHAYIACAHCHLDGEADLRTWDFTDRGEGLRNTISLLGRGGTEHGPIHWSANFDEVQDFEHDIRGPFGGTGLMSDDDFHTGTRDTTLGDGKAGVSADLDALAAFVSSLDAAPRSPHRNPDGSLTQAAEAGRVLFESAALGCTECHGGPRLTDSGFGDDAEPRLHDVGTLGSGSGQRLGGPLPGLDTPTLVELWNSAPYLHDGSAATLRDVLTTRNVGDAHGSTAALSDAQIDQLIAYLLSLE